MTLNDIENALLSVTDNVGHYEAFEETDQYIVWAEDSQADSVWADDKMQEQALSGTTDYFTKTENDPNVKKIQNAFNSIEISWKLNSIQHEKDTGCIHYEWVWEIWQE